MNITRWIFIGMLIGITSSWLIGDEARGVVVCISFIILNELLHKFAKVSGDGK